MTIILKLPCRENISELMKNQPDAKQRSPDFFSPRNCATQFQQVNQKYFSHNYGVYDTARGCEASFLADHLIRVLATGALFNPPKCVLLEHSTFKLKFTTVFAEALLEKSQLLGKNLAAAQSRSVTPQNPSSPITLYAILSYAHVSRNFALFYLQGFSSDWSFGSSASSALDIIPDTIFEVCEV